MCGTDLYPDGVSFSAEESLLADERARFIEHDDPGDDSHYLDKRDPLSDPASRLGPHDEPGLARESTAPNVGRITSLEEYVSQSAEPAFSELFARLGALERQLDQRTDRIARSLTHLALAVSELRSRSTLGQRFAAWFREQVYRGPRRGVDDDYDMTGY